MFSISLILQKFLCVHSAIHKTNSVYYQYTCKKKKKKPFKNVKNCLQMYPVFLSSVHIVNNSVLPVILSTFLLENVYIA